jgi:hypothetical protein
MKISSVGYKSEALGYYSLKTKSEWTITMRTEASKLQTQEKKIMTREG